MLKVKQLQKFMMKLIALLLNIQDNMPSMRMKNGKNKIKSYII